VEENRDLRVDFLIKKITEKRFKNAVYNRAMKNDRRQYIFDIYSFINVVVTDICQRFMSDETSTLEQVRSLEREYDNAFAYANERLVKYSKLYGIKPIKFNDDWLLCYESGRYFRQ
jgi:hypothetical protein